MTRKLFITGSQGYIGSRLVSLLLQKKYEVIGLDVGYYTGKTFMPEGHDEYPIFKKDLRHVTHDDLKGIDTIIHLAGMSNDPLGNFDEELTYAINHRATLHLAEKAVQAGVKKFIFLSSCSLYGQSDQVFLTEHADLAPRTAYARSKVLAERDLKQYKDDLSIAYLRCSTVFGPSPCMRFDLVVNRFVGLAHTNQVLEVYDGGRQWRPLVHVDDIAKVCKKIIEAPDDVVRNHIFNVGDKSQNYQIKTIAERILYHYPHAKIRYFNQQSHDTRGYNVSFEKLNKQLKFQCVRTLDDGIQDLKRVLSCFPITPCMVTSGQFVRLDRIEYLIQQGLLDNQLWRL